jgi:hypothetical protein
MIDYFPLDHPLWADLGFCPDWLYNIQQEKLRNPLQQESFLSNTAGFQTNLLLQNARMQTGKFVRICNFTHVAALFLFC